MKLSKDTKKGYTMRFYTWRATRDAPKGQIKYGNWWISKTRPTVDCYGFDEYKGGDDKYLRLFFRRLDKAYEEATTRKRAMASMKLLMSAKAIMMAEKKAVEKPIRATGFNWDNVL